MEWEWLSAQVAHLPATEAPLSANVGLVRTDGMLWIYDVGAAPAAAAEVNALPGKKTVVLSHFHPDHMGNLEQVEYEAFYGGTFTCKKAGGGIVVSRELFLPEGGAPVPAAFRPCQRLYRYGVCRLRLSGRCALSGG